MIPEDVKRWIQIFERVTSTTAIILLVLWFVYQNTGDRNQALYEARVNAEEAVKVTRVLREEISAHVRMASEEASVSRMILIQICINTANGDRTIIALCGNYR